MNKCMFIGNVGKDPEVRNLTSGTSVANFSLACSERYKDKEGNKKETTEWVNCVAWDRKAEVIEQYVNKGDKLFIEGKMTTRSWEDNAGNKRYTTEIVVLSMEMLGGKKTEGTPVSTSDKGQKAKAEEPAHIVGEDEDDLPF